METRDAHESMTYIIKIITKIREARLAFTVKCKKHEFTHYCFLIDCVIFKRNEKNGVDLVGTHINYNQVPNKEKAWSNGNTDTYYSFPKFNIKVKQGRGQESKTTRGIITERVQYDGTTCQLLLLL